MVLTKQEIAELMKAVERIETWISTFKRALFDLETQEQEQLDEVIRPTYGAKLPDVKSPKDKEIDDACQAIEMANKRKKQAQLAKARDDVKNKQADLLSANKPSIARHFKKF